MMHQIFGWNMKPSKPATVVFSAASMIGFWIISLGLVPFLFQWLKVEPNEITVERPYIENNIKCMHMGFDLEKVEENEFPASGKF